METITVLVILPDGDIDFNRSKNYVYEISEEGEEYHEALSQSEGYFCELCGVDVDDSQELLHNGYYIHPDGTEIWMTSIKTERVRSSVS